MRRCNKRTGKREGDHGTQVHLSVDPDHRPAARAHTAIELSDQTTEVERRLRVCRAGLPDCRDRRDPDALLPGPSGQPLGATSREATSTVVVQHRRSSCPRTNTTAGNAPLPLGVVWQRTRSPASGARVLARCEKAASRLDAPTEAFVGPDPKSACERSGTSRPMTTSEGPPGCRPRGELARSRNHALEARLLHVVRDGGDERARRASWTCPNRAAGRAPATSSAPEPERTRCIVSMRSRKSPRPTARMISTPSGSVLPTGFVGPNSKVVSIPGRGGELRRDGAESVDGAVQIGVEAHGVDPVRAELSHHRDVGGQVTHVGVPRRSPMPSPKAIVTPRSCSVASVCHRSSRVSS